MAAGSGLGMRLDVAASAPLWYRRVHLMSCAWAVPRSVCCDCCVLSCGVTGVPLPTHPLSRVQREWMTAMVEAHAKDDVIWYYAGILLSQFEGAEEQSHTYSPSTTCCVEWFWVFQFPSTLPSIV